MNESSGPLISVVIPTYNRPDLLVRALESVLSQTYARIELLVVDDRGEDGVNRGVIESLSARDSRVKYIRNDRHPQGIPGARNQGVDHAAGEYVAFLDDDDEWYPHHLEESVRHLRANPDVDWLFARTEDIRHDKVIGASDFERSFRRYKVERRGEVNLLETENLFENFIRFPRSVLMGCSVFRRSVFDKVRFDEEIRYMDDLFFKFEAISQRLKMAYINSIHLRYYMHDRNASNINPNKPLRERFKANEDMARTYERMLSKLQLRSEARSAVKQALADIYFWMLGYTYLQAGERKLGRSYLLKGFLLQPLNSKYWKTFVVRYLLSIPVAKAATSAS